MKSVNASLQRKKLNFFYFMRAIYFFGLILLFFSKSFSSSSLLEEKDGLIFSKPKVKNSYSQDLSVGPCIDKKCSAFVDEKLTIFVSILLSLKQDMTERDIFRFSSILRNFHLTDKKSLSLIQNLSIEGLTLDDLIDMIALMKDKEVLEYAPQVRVYFERVFQGLPQVSDRSKVIKAFLKTRRAFPVLIKRLSPFITPDMTSQERETMIRSLVGYGMADPSILSEILLMFEGTSALTPGQRIHLVQALGRYKQSMLACFDQSIKYQDPSAKKKIDYLKSKGLSVDFINPELLKRRDEMFDSHLLKTISWVCHEMTPEQSIELITVFSKKKMINEIKFLLYDSFYFNLAPEKRIFYIRNVY